MKNRINILAILCCIGLFGSCNKIDPESGNSAASGVVTIQLDTPSKTDTKTEDTILGTTEENYIGMTQVIFFASTSDKTGLVDRIIIFDAAASNKSDGQYTWDAETKKLSVNGVNINNTKGVCVVSNATDTPGNGYDMTTIKVGETTEADLLKAITKYAELPSHQTIGNGILMSYIINNHNFSTNHTLTVPLTRQLVKINLTVKLDQTFASLFHTTSFWDTELEGNTFLNIYNIQDQSFVYSTKTETKPASAPSTSNLLDFRSVKVTKSGTDAATQWDLTIYTYENPQMGNLLENKNASTWFILNLPYKNSSGVFTKNYYKFYINNIDDAENPHKTERNHIYNLAATVNGFGSLTPDDGSKIRVTTTVLDWNRVNMGDDVGQAVTTVNKTAVVLIGREIDKSVIVKGVKNPDLKKLFSDPNYSDDMIESEKKLILNYEVIDNNSIRITIENKAEKIYDGARVTTFDIQNGEYKHRISVTYQHLILPNTIGYFGGDPQIPASEKEGTLYPKRLAVSQKKFVFEDYKEVYYTNINDEDNLTTTKNAFYYGKDMNVLAEALPNKDMYLAFKFCALQNKDKNNDGKIDNDEMVWYLPSHRQLMALYVFSKGAGISELTTVCNDSSYFISASPTSIKECVLINMLESSYNRGFTKSGYKDYNGYSLCVRDL